MDFFDIPNCASVNVSITCQFFVVLFAFVQFSLIFNIFVQLSLYVRYFCLI